MKKNKFGSWIKKRFNNYKSGFKPFNTKLYYKTLLYDFLVLLIISVSFLSFGFLLNRLSENLLGGSTSALELQNAVIQMSTLQLEEFMQEVKLLVFAFLIGLVLIAVAFFCKYSYSRHSIWNNLTRNKSSQKVFFKWILLTFSLLIISTIYIMIVSLISFLVQNFLLLFYYNEIYFYITQVIAMLVSLFLLILLLNLLFSIKLNFVKEFRVWHSIGKGFGLVKEKFKSLIEVIFYQYFTLLLISLAILLPLRHFFDISNITLRVVQFIILLLFLSWSRIYFYKTVKEK